LIFKHVPLSSALLERCVERRGGVGAAPNLAEANRVVVAPAPSLSVGVAVLLADEGDAVVVCRLFAAEPEMVARDEGARAAIRRDLRQGTATRGIEADAVLDDTAGALGRRVRLAVAVEVAAPRGCAVAMHPVISTVIGAPLAAGGIDFAPVRMPVIAGGGGAAGLVGAVGVAPRCFARA